MVLRNRLRRPGLVGAVSLLAVVLSACASGSNNGGSTTGTKAPLVIGASVSLTGDFADPGKAVKAGYQLWADTVNAKGGILGRQVQFKIVDDTSSPTQVVTNYQNLINKDKVDLVFGPFSSLLTVPASQVAKRYGYAFLEPAGGGPTVFDQKLDNLFFVQPAPVVKSGRRVRRLDPLAAGREAAEDCRLRRARRPVRGADRGEHPDPVRGRRHQDGLQAGLPGRDPGLLGDHGQGRRDEARRARQRHPERGRLRPGQEPGAAEVQPEVHVHVQRRQLAARVPQQGGRGQHHGHHVRRRLVPGFDRRRAAPTSPPPTSRPTAAPPTRSTTAAPRPTPAGSSWKPSPPRPERSTTPRSSPRCTRAPGRPCSAT